MVWSYSGNPADSAVDAVRFLTGDTDTNDQLLDNEEIAWTNNQVTGSDTAITALRSKRGRSEGRYVPESDERSGTSSVVEAASPQGRQHACSLRWWHQCVR